VLQGSLLAVGDVRIELPGRERAMLRALADRPGAVVSKGDLARRVWNRPDLDPHAVEVAAARLRARLGKAGLAVEAVARRGYRLAPTVR
jgi:uroporphyrinogen-III synthase